jgi:NADP-dependent 3-hydroxy acid dehydrogenase YdfG
VSILAPGIVATELQGHVTDQGAKDWLATAKETIDWLQPEDVAETVAFTAALPAHVNLQQVTIMPTKQAS